MNFTKKRTRNIKDDSTVKEKLTHEAHIILTKLKYEVANKGYRENIGQNELRKFEDEVNKHYADLTFQEQFQLKNDLSIAIDNL